jgi:UDP:flavonoid glycosyltransferase YjiC (YdhE family)
VRVFINTSGSHGDVHPFLAIGRALAARGHEVVFFTHPYFASAVQAAGLEHVHTCADIDHVAVLRDPRLMHPRKGGPFVLDLILRSVPGALEILRREVTARRPDAVLAHHICHGTRWLCSEHDLPLAIGVLCPLFWFARADPVPAPQKRPGRFAAWRARALMSAVRPAFTWYGDRTFNRVRRATGYEPERGVLLADWHGGAVNLGLWSTHFRAPQPEDPPNGRICGFPWYDGAADGLDDDLESYLDDGEPPIVFALGTTAVHAPGDFYDLATRACHALGRRGVLLTGSANGVPRDLPDGVRAFGYAPFSRLLPRGAATVHHGGIGSTAQALRAGRPSVVVAHAHDQFNNGVRVETLGAGTIVHRQRLTVPRLVEALRSVLDDPHVAERSSTVGAALAAEDGAPIAADAIEALA